MDIEVMEALLTRIPKGDLEALEGLYRDFHHAVFSYSLLLLQDRGLAEDNAQDVFLRIWEKASTYRSGGNPKAWIMGIAHHAALDRLRRSNRETSLDGIPEEKLAAGSRMEGRTADRIDMRKALGSLQPRDRQIVLLKAVAGLPSKNVGELLGLPPSTVHWRYQRSLKRLAEWVR